jgi:hypothetical protein
VSVFGAYFVRVLSARNSRDHDAGREATQLELAEALFAAAVVEGDQRGHLDAPRRRRLQRRLDVRAIEAEHGNLHALLRALDGREQRRHAVGGLDDQLHDGISSAAGSAAVIVPPSGVWIRCISAYTPPRVNRAS